jgi:hypothetical protein
MNTQILKILMLAAVIAATSLYGTVQAAVEADASTAIAANAATKAGVAEHRAATDARAASQVAANAKVEDESIFAAIGSSARGLMRGVSSLFTSTTESVEHELDADSEAILETANGVTIAAGRDGMRPNVQLDVEGELSSDAAARVNASESIRTEVATLVETATSGSTDIVEAATSAAEIKAGGDVQVGAEISESVTTAAHAAAEATRAAAAEVANAARAQSDAVAEQGKTAAEAAAEAAAETASEAIADNAIAEEIESSIESNVDLEIVTGIER